VVSTGVSGASLSSSGAVAITTLIAPAGTYAFSLAISDAVAVVTSGGGPGSEVTCYLDSSIGVAVTLLADGAPVDVANSNVVSLSSLTTITVSCYASFDVRDVTADLTWDELTITATTL
jgi:hypothetical protein